MRPTQIAIWLIDVRDEAEFRERHIPGALNMPLSRLEAEAVGIPDDKQPVTVCGKAVGARPRQYAARLRVTRCQRPLAGRRDCWLASGKPAHLRLPRPATTRRRPYR
ncbi:MAG: rhodanese-like domain-containing protein [Devosia sp.]|nr:rhodanese-like domain-containing protein [Devosia sp.]